mgnify:CR=1 FL=1
MENEGTTRNSSVYSHKVKAGRKRTYFFDVMTTKGNDYYLTLTESTRRNDGIGYTRHQIFLYKEDFEKFAECLQALIAYINENQTETVSEEKPLNPLLEEEPEENYTKVDFEDI